MYLKNNLKKNNLKNNCGRDLFNFSYFTYLLMNLQKIEIIFADSNIGSSAAKERVFLFFDKHPNLIERRIDPFAWNLLSRKNPYRYIFP